MKPLSIRLRHEMYFKMIALLDMLWDDVFQNQNNLTEKHISILRKLETTLQSLVLQSERPQA